MKIICVLLAVLMLFGLAVPAFGAAKANAQPPKELVFVRPQTADTPQEVLELYFDMLYRSYAAILPVDISPIIDLDYEMMVNVQNWHELLAMRRRLISEENYCYVETLRKGYSIEYIKKNQLDDQRMAYVKMRDYGKGAVALHFVITGEKGWAYPPIFAVNSQHTMIFTLEDGQYKIAYHYFPGSEGKFENDLPVTVSTEGEYRRVLAKEFAKTEAPEDPVPLYNKTYSGFIAASYAKTHCENRNKAFYFVGDWYGNCMNFASQCIWSGFKNSYDTAENFGSMTDYWYCGKHGGTLAWSGVNSFWGWITGKNPEMQTVVFKNPDFAQKGDLVNIGSYLREEPERYTHALLVVDEEKLLLAQNSPACFVYYCDLANNFARFIRPVSLDG